ncbi:MAG: hypothetical protein AB7I27_12105 [Bacteriovoracaceae bacterium]
MKIISFILLFCFTLNSFASTGSIQELEKVLDDYQYALTVEWDQKDQNVYQEQTKVLFEKLDELMSKGLSKQELKAVLEKKVQNAKTIEAIKLKLALLQNGSTQELFKVVTENRKDFYSRGASWYGGENLQIAGGVLLLVAIIGYAVWFDNNYDCVATEDRWECDQTVSGNTSHTSCGWETYCTQYAKKK